MTKSIKKKNKEQKNKKSKKVRRAESSEKKLKKMSVYFNNVRGIKSKMESLKEIIEELQPDVLGIVETHLDKEEKLEEIEGYITIREEREKKGGGVLMAININGYTPSLK